MTRREFMMIASGAACAPPLVVSARQAESLQSPKAPPPSGPGIPLSFNDPLFSRVTTSAAVVLANGGRISHKSITVGDASIHCRGSATITRCRVTSREVIRVGGPGIVRIDQCWLEAKGVPGDHADVIQAYSPGSTGTIHVTNTAIRAYDTHATAGMFVADNWTGNVRLENVIFWGGPYGLRLHSDVGGNLHIYLKDVFFVGPFRFGAFFITDEGGTRSIIEQWENVRRAVIVDGALVPDSLLSKP
jgi:hypothetical protein